MKLMWVLFFVFIGTIVFLAVSISSTKLPLSQNLLGIQTTLVPSLSPTASPSTTTSLCHTENGLPDKNCTPGAADPKVTQETIHQTICVSGYTKTVRPPVTYTNKLKLQQMKAYGYTDMNPKHYEEDHLIPLEVGGSPDDPNNLWPEPDASPNDKDSVENRCNRKVCRGEILLEQAQQEIIEDWHTACL